MTNLPYYQSHADGRAVHCPRCQTSRGGYSLRINDSIVTERIDDLHKKMTVQGCGHVFVYHYHIDNEGL